MIRRALHGKSRRLCWENTLGLTPSKNGGVGKEGKDGMGEQHLGYRRSLSTGLKSQGETLRVGGKKKTKKKGAGPTGVHATVLEEKGQWWAKKNVNTSC